MTGTVHDYSKTPVLKPLIAPFLPRRVDVDIPVDLTWKRKRPAGTEIDTLMQEMVEAALKRKIKGARPGTHERDYYQRDYENWERSEKPVAGYAPRNTRRRPF